MCKPQDFDTDPDADLRSAQAQKDWASLSEKQRTCEHPRWTWWRTKWVRGRQRRESVCQECGAHYDEDQ
jgi:hypothetical protein